MTMRTFTLGSWPMLDTDRDLQRPEKNGGGHSASELPPLISAYFSCKTTYRPHMEQEFPSWLKKKYRSRSGSSLKSHLQDRHCTPELSTVEVAFYYCTDNVQKTMNLRKTVWYSRHSIIQYDKDSRRFGSGLSNMLGYQNLATKKIFCTYFMPFFSTNLATIIVYQPCFRFVSESVYKCR